MHPLAYESFSGIPGVRVVDSGIPGPTLAVSACTHGSETVGLDVIDALCDATGSVPSLKA